MRENFADTAVSSTPILDRQAQLRADGDGLGADHLIGLGIIVVVVITTALSLQHATSVPFWRQHLTAIFPELFPARWTVAKMASLGLMAFLVAFAVVAVHEIGHVLGGLSRGLLLQLVADRPADDSPWVQNLALQGLERMAGRSREMIPVASDKLAVARPGLRLRRTGREHTLGMRRAPPADKGIRRVAVRHRVFDRRLGRSRPVADPDGCLRRCADLDATEASARANAGSRY